MNVTIPRKILHIIKELHAAQFRAYLVGGCVRDIHLGRTPKDWDIVTDAKPSLIQQVFPNRKMVGAKFGVAMVYGVEVATFRSEGEYEDGRHPEKVSFVDTPEEDSARRDFTINALYYDPFSEDLLDFHGGRADLSNKLLRCIGNPAARFKEDYLRMMRAVRFTSGLQLRMHPETSAAITVNASNILDISYERVRDELSRILTQGDVDFALRLMNRLGLLEWVLNPIYKMQGVEQPKQYHPEGDVFTHTCLAVSQLQPGCSLTLALGVLLHDVGKPATAALDMVGNPRFFGHDEVGARIARAFLGGRLKYPNDIVDRVVWLVANHMRIYEVDRMRLSKVRQFMAEPGWDELVQLAECDTLGSMLPLEPHPVHALLAGRDDLARVKAEPLVPPCLINGDDLIGLGLKPGPLFGTILTEAHASQMEGAITNRNEALEFAQQWVGR